MSNYDNAVSIIESRLKLIEAGDTRVVVCAEASMAIEMAHSCGVIGIDEYAVFVRRFNVAYNEQARACLNSYRIGTKVNVEA